MDSTSFDHDYCLACADKARAEGMRDRRARLIMLTVAKGYERLAQHAQQRTGVLAALEKRHSK
jgi:hypothetical protein